MVIKKFEVEVVRTDTYTIELDDEVMNEKWMEDFRGFMYDFNSLEEHAEHIAQWRARFNNGGIYGGFPEGYGEIALKGKVNPNAQFPFPAVNISAIDEDNDIDITIKEVD